MTLAELLARREALLNAWRDLRDPDEAAVGPVLGADGSLSLRVGPAVDLRCRLYDLVLSPAGDLSIVTPDGESRPVPAVAR
ncbi:hypothetical protein KIN34_14280 [Cellulomonas sp. DKR-3]|uniref:Uncharacterized protein n=1 Tax=Cellulomonas fulva TaxID=2835530 RepID=A0ABS5U253_9CELL|nr:hypothetical protein [Cellulomonas fulva]MBT0995451.1 hypothetical protein [Cellulomonas fulva]